MRRRFVLVAPALLALFAACSDVNAPDRTRATVLSPANPTNLDQSEERGVFERYVAIGTSISMGWQSDGVIAATQETSWPAQLAGMTEHSMTQPYIDGTGCRSPLVKPLISFIRLSGESAAADKATLSCSPLRADVVKPVQNLAINAALTKDALFTTPENTTDAANKMLISRVLQPGMTQVSSMIAQNPTLVSVELGGNEVLNAITGIAIEGVSMFPYDLWQPLYDEVLDNVQARSTPAVIVGLTDDVAAFPAFRRGSELWEQRVPFAVEYNVNVADDCSSSRNLIFVPVIVPKAVATGLAFRNNNLGPYTLHCTAGSPTAEDNILTPEEAAVVNALLAKMNEHIRSEANRRNFAYFALQSLYGRPALKPRFDVVALMTTDEPYGRFISLDGVHPSALGSRVLAKAAANALERQYHFGIPDHHRELIANR